MDRISMWPLVLGLSLAMIVVVLIENVPHSLGYAGSALVLISLVGWVLEARAVAGPPPDVEPEHEEEEAPGPSYWPVVAAVGVVAIAAGLIMESRYGGLIIAVPLAIGSGAAWMSLVRREAALAAEAEAPAAGPPIVTPAGRVLTPVPPNVLAAQAAQGAAIALERPMEKKVSRRAVVHTTFWTGLGAGLLATTAAIVDFLYPRGIVGFGGVIGAGTIDQFPPGSKTDVPAGKFWLVHLTAEQGGPGLLALWWRCPHLGCTIPWREGFNFVDPGTGQARRGWFRCPCHGSTYTDAGVRVFGPAPRSMDRMQISIDPATGRVDVNTGSIESGTPDNARFAVPIPAAATNPPAREGEA